LLGWALVWKMPYSVTFDIKKESKLRSVKPNYEFNQRDATT